MKLLTSILFVGWMANDSYGFVPVPVTPLKRVNSIASKKVEYKETESSDKTRYCIPLDEIDLNDLPKVGGKTASLGEMIQQLTPLGVAVPGGFGVTSAAYDAVLDRFQLRERLELLLRDVDVNNLDDLASEYYRIALLCIICRPLTYCSSIIPRHIRPRQTGKYSENRSTSFA
jgi:hypothetical protein